MLITTNKTLPAKQATLEGDQIKVVHAENVTALLLQNKEARKDRANGFTQQRTMRHVCDMSNIQYLRACQKYPDLVSPEGHMDRKALRKLRFDAEFAPCFVVEGGI